MVVVVKKEKKEVVEEEIRREGGMVEQEEEVDERMRGRRRRTVQEKQLKKMVGRKERWKHLRISLHAELQCMTATVTRSDAEWNVETWRSISCWHSRGP